MAVLWGLLVGLVLWITLWALGVKSFDAFLLLTAIVVGATAYRFVKPFIDQQLGRSQ